MKYKLKEGVESFEVVDGEFAGRKYVRGKTYDKIPPSEKKKFQEVRSQTTEVRNQKDEKKTDTSKATERSKP